MFNDTEEAVYSQLQKDVLAAKEEGSYALLVQCFGFTSNQQTIKFLFRTFLGFHLESVKSPNGAIPLIPDAVTKDFVAICLERAVELNCIYTNKAITYLEQMLADRAFRAYELAHKLGCPFIAANIIDHFADITLSPQWFNHYCAKNNLKLLNPQSLEEVRRKFFHSNVLLQFYVMLQNTIHQIPHLLYNMDETSCCCSKNGKIVVPEGKSALASEEKAIGHITTLCCCNAAGEAMKQFLILPMLVNLPKELYDFATQCVFTSSPSGWMTSKIFFIWSLFFSSELTKKRAQLIRIYGTQAANAPCFLIMDGHKSRLNAEAIEVLYANNVRVIIFPAHTSHVVQLFDVCIARAFKGYLRTAKDTMSPWLQIKLQHLNQSAQKRYILVLSIIDAWKKAATTSNICSAWEKAGLFPLNSQRVIQSPYVRASVPGDVVAPGSNR